MNITQKILMIIGIFALLLIAGCSGETSDSDDDAVVDDDSDDVSDDSGDTIRIGFVGPLTGDVALIGQQNKAAIEIAVDEINADGGIDGKLIEIIFEDGMCSAKDAKM